DIDEKKFLKFQDKLKSTLKSIELLNFPSLEGYVSFNLLLQMKFPETSGSDLFGNSELDNLNYIDEILKSSNYSRIKDFEAFIVKLADRNRISIQALTANNMLSAIEESKNREFDKVLFAIGIKDVGEVGAKNLANYFKSLNNLINASYEELI